MKEAGKELSDEIRQENRDAIWWFHSAANVSKYSWVMERITGALDSAINGVPSRQDKSEVSESVQPSEEQGWLAWGVNLAIKSTAYIPGMQGIDVCYEIIRSQERRIQFFQDPATHEFIKDQEELPNFFYQKVQENGLVDRTISMNDSSNYKNVIGKLLKNEKLVGEVLKIPKGITKENIKQFFETLYSNDTNRFRNLISKTLNETIKNADLRSNIYEISKFLPEHSVDLAKLLPYLGLNEQEKDLLKKPFMEEVLFHTLKAVSCINASHLSSISAIIESNPVNLRAILKHLPAILSQSSNTEILSHISSAIEVVKENKYAIREAGLIQVNMAITDEMFALYDSLLPLVSSALEKKFTHQLARDVSDLSKESDPEKLLKHTKSLVNNSLNLFCNLDLTSVKKLYRNKENTRLIDTHITKLLESYGLKAHSHKLVKFVLNNQKAIAQFQEKGSIIGLAFSIARNPIFGGKILIKNRKLLFLLMKKQKKTYGLELYIKDVISEARNKKSDISQELKISTQKNEFKNDRIVKFFSSDFAGVNLTRMNLDQSFDFSEVKMSKILFDTSKIKSSFKGSKLSTCSFVNCDLREASFEGAQLSKVSFKGAKLSGRVITELEGAKMDEYTKKSFNEAKTLSSKKKLSFTDRLKKSDRTELRGV